MVSSKEAILSSVQNENKKKCLKDKLEKQYSDKNFLTAQDWTPLKQMCDKQSGGKKQATGKKQTGGQNKQEDLSKLSLNDLVEKAKKSKKVSVTDLKEQIIKMF